MRSESPGRNSRVDDSLNPVCPKCGSHDTRPSRSKYFIDDFWRALSFFPYRCRACWTRFRRRQSPGRAELEAGSSA